MKRGISPEEKLLNLIKNQKKKPEESMAEAINIEGITGGVSMNRASGQIADYIPRKNFSLARLGKIFRVILAVSFLYLLYTFINPLINLKKTYIPEPLTMQAITSNIDQEDTLKPLEFYLKGISEKQIFATASAGLGSSSTLKSLSDTDLLKEISLVGIIGGDDPQAAIEDKKIQKTYYLKEGQFIRQFQIKDIQDGKVILDYRGERFEFYL